jgi:hypothetical protein
VASNLAEAAGNRDVADVVVMSGSTDLNHSFDASALNCDASESLIETLLFVVVLLWEPFEFFEEYQPAV